MLQARAHCTLLKYPLQECDHTHTTERDTPYLHTEIPTTSQWSHTHNRKRYTIPTYWNTHYKSVITHTTERDTPYLHTEIPTTSQWSHTHNRKRYTIPTYWNTHYKSVITHTTERDTPYLHTEIPTTSQWSHTQQKEIHHTYILKYPLQVSDHTHNRKRYTIPTC